MSRAEMAGAHPDFEQVSPEVGELDDGAFRHVMEADPDEALSILADLATATDPELRAAARRLAAVVFVRAARNGVINRKGIGRLTPRAGSSWGDLDVERTLDRTEGLLPSKSDDIVARTWGTPSRAVCLLIDRSGSMGGKGVSLASVAAAAVILSRNPHTDVSIVAFSDRALVLEDHGGRRAPEAVVSDILTLRGRGRTDIALALRTAAARLRSSNATERVAVLLSDCLSTVGDDPGQALSGFDRLEVLCTSRHPDAVEAGRRLAGRGGGRYTSTEDFGALAPALARLLA